ncbi:MAG TPA: TonB-dependent siderophore receptor [Aquabacterium sp.]|nr:TonB-dependent siderophore receptor [Aquabacterium sp.]
MAFRSPFVPSTLALAASLAMSLASSLATAQQAPQTVTVTGGKPPSTASVAGFGDVPTSKLPMSVISINTSQLQDAAIQSLADITRLDASIGDAYNSAGYWSNLSVRGFILDNRFNYRRDGLPINAETDIGLDNKQAIEVLKGVSGIQAGTSAPGGLVNLVVKRPVAGLRSALLGWGEDNSWKLAMDLSDRDRGVGWRVNAAASELDPQLRNAKGHKRLVALAGDVALGRGGLLEAEVEWSRQSQPSQPGFSLLGNRLPDAHAIDPRINLNNQPWSLPVVLQGTTGSLRWSQEITPEWRVTVHGMAQRLKSDDRVAFPFGCSAENSYDRYCSDGSFDLYDFRSDGERRDTDAIDASLAGRTTIAGMVHHVTLGLLHSRYEARFNRQAYNWVGVGTTDGTTITPADPTLTDENTQRDERSTELRLQDAVEITKDLSLWAGLRHTRLDRASVRTDGSRGTRYDQSFTTPWLALSHTVGSSGTVYASWGRGIESEVVPNRARFNNPGRALPALKSRQVELGYKHRGDTVDAGVAVFEVRRPVWADIGSCDDDNTCTRRADGEARHRGLEADIDWRAGAWNLRASAMALQARRRGSADANVEGKRPTNVPDLALKTQATYNVGALPGLALLGFVTYEGDRAVLPDNSIRIGGWTRVDLGLRYATTLGGRTLTLRAGVDNVADRRAWKESPYQFSHAYLYPMAGRRGHATVNVQF